MDGDVMQSSWVVGNNSTFGGKSGGLRDCKGGREILTTLIDKHRARVLVGRR